uniref:Uncharacterized protein n=1 Tax=Arion vulgaris TaxID=1028688 RepID=A0A0B7AE34_9EUPU
MITFELNTILLSHSYEITEVSNRINKPDIIKILHLQVLITGNKLVSLQFCLISGLEERKNTWSS